MRTWQQTSQHMMAHMQRASRCASVQMQHVEFTCGVNLRLSCAIKGASAASASTVHLCSPSFVRRVSLIHLDMHLITCRSDPAGHTTALPGIAEDGEPKGDADLASTPAVSSSTTCHTCGEKFTSLQEQREHFKLDWHRLNVKRSIKGLPPLAEQACERLLDDDASSLSGSGIALRSWMVI